jgi:hypothetical protein
VPKFDTFARHTRVLFPYAQLVSVMDREWTDKRTDDLADRVGRFEANVDRRFDQVDARFDKVDARFDKVDERFDRADERFDRVDQASAKLNRTIWAGIIVVGISKILFG